MNNIITKIENKIKKQEEIPVLIQRIDDMLTINSHLLEKNEILNFTVSMGLSCRENLNNIDKILQKSDELLYEAKKSGRNRLIRFNR